MEVASGPILHRALRSIAPRRSSPASAEKPVVVGLKVAWFAPPRRSDIDPRPFHNAPWPVPENAPRTVPPLAAARSVWTRYERRPLSLLPVERPLAPSVDSWQCPHYKPRQTDLPWRAVAPRRRAFPKRRDPQTRSDSAIPEDFSAPSFQSLPGR